MYQSIRQRTTTWTPAVRGTGETKALFSVTKGERVLWLTLQVMQAAQAGCDSTVIVGDGDDDNGYLTTTEYTNVATTTLAAGGIVAGAGASLANCGGKLYAADDTVDLVYVSSGTDPDSAAHTPILRISIATTRNALHG